MKEYRKLQFLLKISLLHKIALKSLDIISLWTQNLCIRNQAELKLPLTKTENGRPYR